MTAGVLEDLCSTSSTNPYNAQYGVRSHFDRDTVSAGTLDYGLTVFGTGLSMKSGCSIAVHLQWDMGSGAAERWFCGRSAGPATAPFVWNGPNP